MNNPTKAQVKEFWERCEARCLKCRHLITSKVTPDTCCCHTYELDLDLNNLFKYAVPIAHSKLDDEALYDLMIRWVRDIVFGKDPALALFWAIYPVLKEATSGKGIC